MEPQELAPLAQMDPTPPEMDPDLPPPPPHQTLATLTVTSEQPPPPEKKESRDALEKPSAPPFDQAELPLKQKISSRAREAIVKWKNDLPSPPSFLTSWASKLMAFTSRTKKSSTSTISLDSSMGTDISRSIWGSRTYKSSPHRYSSRSTSPTLRPQTTPSLTVETESLQVLHGPLRHISERSPPNSYPLVEPHVTPLLRSAMIRAYGDLEMSGGLAHFIPSNIFVTNGLARPTGFGDVTDETRTSVTFVSPALTPDRVSPESSRAPPPPAPPPQNIWPFRSLIFPQRLSQIFNKKKATEGRPVAVPLVPLSTSFAETQTPPERTRDSKGTIVRRDRRHHKERSRRKDRSKSRDRDRYEEIMEIEYNQKSPKNTIPKKEVGGVSVSRRVTFPPVDRSAILVKAPLRNYDSDDEDMSCGHWCEYVIVVVLSSILLVASVVLVLFWCLYYRKGYAWNDNPAVQFNLHPTLMITGFVFFSGFSMLLYRISRCCRRIYVKLLHTLFHTLAIPCVVLGFMAVLDSHNLADPPIPNFYSIHSWMGFVTMGLFALQFVVGFFSFLLLLCCDSATAGFRASLVPVHATFGLTTFMLAIATCLTGLTEKAYFNFGADYSSYPEEGIIMNALAMVLVALAILVSYAVRREPLRVHSISYVSERL